MAVLTSYARMIQSLVIWHSATVPSSPSYKHSHQSFWPSSLPVHGLKMASITSPCYASLLNSASSISHSGSPISCPRASFHKEGSPSTASASREQEWRRLHPKPCNPNDLLTVASPRSCQPPPSISTRAPGRRPIRTLPPPSVIGHRGTQFELILSSIDVSSSDVDRRE